MAKLFVDTYGYIDYFERPDSPKESYRDGEIIIQRTFDTAWDTRWIFIKKVVGFAETVNDGEDTAYIQRSIPMAYFPDDFPVFEDLDFTNDGRWVYCTDLVSVEGIKPTGWDSSYAVGTFQTARCTFVFKSLNYRVLSDQETLQAGIPYPADAYLLNLTNQDALPDPSILPANYELPKKETKLLRYISKKVQPSSQHLVLPYGKLFFITDQGTKLPSNNGINKLIPSADIIYTWHEVPSQDLNNTNQLKRIQSMIGTVNREVFDGYPAGTLLLTAVNNKPYRQVGGYYASDIEMRMRYFNATDLQGKTLNVGHNWVIRFLYDANFTGPVPGSIEWTNAYRYTMLSSNAELTGRKVFDSSWFRSLFDVSTYDYSNLPFTYP